MERWEEIAAEAWRDDRVLVGSASWYAGNILVFQRVIGWPDSDCAAVMRGSRRVIQLRRSARYHFPSEVIERYIRRFSSPPLFPGDVDVVFLELGLKDKIERMAARYEASYQWIWESTRTFLSRKLIVRNGAFQSWLYKIDLPLRFSRDVPRVDGKRVFRVFEQRHYSSMAQLVCSGGRWEREGDREYRFIPEGRKRAVSGMYTLLRCCAICGAQGGPRRVKEYVVRNHLPGDVGRYDPVPYEPLCNRCWGKSQAFQRKVRAVDDLRRMTNLLEKEIRDVRKKAGKVEQARRASPVPRGLHAGSEGRRHGGREGIGDDETLA